MQIKQDLLSIKIKDETCFICNKKLLYNIFSPQDDKDKKCAYISVNIHVKPFFESSDLVAKKRKCGCKRDINLTCFLKSQRTTTKGDDVSCFCEISYLLLLGIYGNKILASEFGNVNIVFKICHLQAINANRLWNKHTCRLYVRYFFNISQHSKLNSTGRHLKSAYIVEM